MNTIPTKQNEERQLERLSAQRELYSSAKRIYRWQIIGTVVIPLLLVIISLFDFGTTVYAGIFSLLFFLIDLLFISPAIAKRKVKAAKIQELFDCDVLDIPLSSLKATDSITVEEVLQHFQAHQKIHTNVEKVRDWYPIVVGTVPLHVARLICQRTNCWWDAKLRERYTSTLRAISICLPLLLLFIATCVNMPLEQLVLALSSLMPFFRFANKEYSDHRSANTRLEKTLAYIDKVWHKIYSGQTVDFRAESRLIQDEIYENRSRSAFVLDWIYRLYRDQNEVLMNKSADILITEIRQSPFFTKKHLGKAKIS